MIGSTRAWLDDLNDEIRDFPDCSLNEILDIDNALMGGIFEMLTGMRVYFGCGMNVKF